MKKIELVYREILYNAIEKKNKNLTQSYLASALKISLSTVNLALKSLVRMNAVRVKKNGFDIIDAKKILYYWASVRNLEKDIIYKTRIEMPVRDFEKQLPDEVIFSAFSAYKLKFNDVPADYSEVYVYGSEEELNEIKKRFKIKEKEHTNKLVDNLYILEKDNAMDKYGKVITTANLFVDLWSLKQWYAKDFLKSLEVKIGRVLE